jgi:hypothetical protein
MRSKLLIYALIGFLFFVSLAGLAFGEEVTSRDRGLPEMKKAWKKAANKPSKISNSITMFMCGDVMTGRGIDQVLSYPSDPLIHEPYMKSARGYVELAEKVNFRFNNP